MLRELVTELYLIMLKSAVQDGCMQTQQYSLKLITQGNFSKNIVTQIYILHRGTTISFTFFKLNNMNE